MVAPNTQSTALFLPGVFLSIVTIFPIQNIRKSNENKQPSCFFHDVGPNLAQILPLNNFCCFWLTFSKIYMLRDSNSIDKGPLKY